MADWPLVPIDELVAEIIDRRGVTPTKLGSAFKGSGHRVISAKLVKGASLDFSVDAPRYIDSPTYGRWMRTPLRADDVILTSEAPLGEVAYLREDVDWVLGQRLFGIRTDKRRLVGRYLYYALQADPAKADLMSRATGTTAQGIRQTELRRVRVPLPPLPVQQRISEVLGALDDKVEVNRRRSSALDHAARSIFRSWFRGPSDKSVPSGRVLATHKPLSSLFEINPPRRLPSDAPAPYLDMANMPTQGPSPERVSLRVPGSGARFASGDTLLARITPCLENGKVALVDFLPEGRHGWGSTEYIILRPKPPLPDEFAYCLARDPDFVTYAIARMNGSSGRQRVSAAAIGEFLIPVPSAAAASRFGDVVRPMFQRISLLNRENETLASMRNALLPRLVAGDFEDLA